MKLADVEVEHYFQVQMGLKMYFIEFWKHLKVAKALCTSL